jgi:hypothetical protein
MPEAANRPNDVEALKGMILEHSAKLEAAEALLIFKNLELEKLRFEIAYLKRMKYGPMPPTDSSPLSTRCTTSAAS